jgi:hypothetical protein
MESGISSTEKKLYPVKLSAKMDGELKSFYDRQKLK